MDALLHLVQAINAYLSNYVLVALLVGAGLLFTVRTRFAQVRFFAEGMRRVFGGFSLSGEKHAGGMSSFQALATAVAAQVGTGNIVGACGAILVGGPGAIFWMWVIAFLGMATNYAEAVLAQRTRVVKPDGSVHGGPAYYIQAAFPGRFGRALATFFAAAIILALGFMGSMVQSNSIAATCATAFGVPAWAMGLAVAVIAGFVFLGGVRRIASLTEKLVPLMALFYLAGSAAVLVAHASNLPVAFALIFQCAFDPHAQVGGVTFGIVAAVTQGAKRGLFSNEAGMGSTPHAHALANVRNPHEQGVTGIAAVFIDTFVVVTMTALVVISVLYVGDGAMAQGPSAGIDKTNMAQVAFSSLMGESLGGAFVAVCLLFFAFSTIIGWNFFARLNVEWLLGRRAVPAFSIMALAFIFAGSLLANDLVWELADMFNMLMVLPNVMALAALSGTVAGCARTRGERCELPVQDDGDAGAERAEGRMGDDRAF